LPEIAELFVQVLLIAKEAGVLKLGNTSLDGSKIHANASKSKAISYKRLLKLEKQLSTKVAELLALSEQADESELPEEMDIAEEIALRQYRLANLAQAKAGLEMRAEERYQAEKAEYEAKLRERESRIMKNSANDGFDQHYNAQLAVEQESFLIVANTPTNHANDQQEAIPTLDAISAELGKPEAGALDNGYFSQSNITEMERRGIELYIATGREPHHRSSTVCRVAGATARRCEPQGQNGLRVEDGDRQTDLRVAEVHSGTGDWYHQRDYGFPSVLAARAGGSSR